MSQQADEADEPRRLVMSKPADEPTSGQGRRAEEAGDAEIAEADEAYEANETNEANKVDLADKATDATEITKANEADVADKPGDAEEAKADETNEAKADEAEAKADDVVEAIVIDAANYAIAADDANGAVLYSLTKYSAIIAEVKGYFGITAPDNQLGRRSSCSLRSKNQYQLDNQLEVVIEKGLV